jgi:hypothetical protein
MAHLHHRSLCQIRNKEALLHKDNQSVLDRQGDFRIRNNRIRDRLRDHAQADKHVSPNKLYNPSKPADTSIELSS